MKTQILVIISISFLVAFISSYDNSYGDEWSPCCIHVTLDKTEYNPGDTVKINAMATDYLANSNDTVSVKIYDVTFGPDYENMLYQDNETFSQGRATFEYQAPQSSDRYRYLVDVESGGLKTVSLFFTKKDASKIVISDFHLLTPTVKQGDSLKLEAKIVDGLGNQIHYLWVSATAEIPESNSRTELYTEADLSPTESMQPNYWTNGTINGTINVGLTAKPGTYNLVLVAKDTTDSYSSTNVTIPYQVVENPDKPTPGSVLGPVGFSLDKTKFFTQQPIEVRGITAYDNYGDAIPNVPLKGEIIRYDIQNNRLLQILQQQETTSDKNGTFTFSFSPVGLRAGYYEAVVYADYEGVKDNRGSPDMENVKNFTISELGKQFNVTVDGWYFIPLNATFDRENKKLTLDLDSSDSFRRVDFTIPNELLDGNFTVIVNGQERDGGIQKHLGYTSFSPWPGQDNHTTIVVVGTSAIPEFPYAIPILLASLASFIVFYRIKFQK
ncbi:MAG: hypothetical protein KGH88_06510 [Thaumarchaeota archaeon]|nr:hypothetical protein [Nitrososphaerota archaeon]